MKYRAVGFDYGGVLTGMPSIDLSHKIEDLLGLPPGKYEAVYYRYNEKVNLGQISWSELWESVLEDLGLKDKYDSLMELFKANAFGEICLPVLNIVDEIRNRGLKTGLLSNNTLEVAKRIRQDGLQNHFDVINVSAETGFVKPDIRAFEHFARDLQIELPELIFVDDSRKSLSSAEEVGYTAILYKNADDLRTRLRELGVLS